MPLFEFRCKNCGEIFEEWIPKRGELPPCPYCKGKEVEKIFSPVGVKGSGSPCNSCRSGSCSTCRLR